MHTVYPQSMPDVPLMQLQTPPVQKPFFLHQFVQLFLATVQNS